MAMKNVSEVITLTVLFSCAFVALYLWPPTPSSRQEQMKARHKSTKVEYQNTLLVDRFTSQDFQLGMENNYTKLASNTSLSLFDRIILSEKLYNRTATMYRKNITQSEWKADHLINYFPPAFNCPHFEEIVGSSGYSGRRICGLDLYEVIPRPPECAIYMISDYYSTNERNILEQLANRTDCHILQFIWHGGENIEGESDGEMHKRIEVIKQTGIGVKDENEQFTLRSLMKNNGHAWLDMMFLNIGGREFSVLQQIVEDFDEYSLPFGQLHVGFHVTQGQEESKEYLESSENMIKWFERLEQRGLRTFHTGISFLDANEDEAARAKKVKRDTNEEIDRKKEEEEKEKARKEEEEKEKARKEDEEKEKARKEEEEKEMARKEEKGEDGAKDDKNEKESGKKDDDEKERGDKCSKEMDQQIVLNYAFINIRGRHLLLVGRLE